MTSGHQRAQAIIRGLNVLGPVERVRYLASLARMRKPNRQFVMRYPDFSVPPSHLAFDAYSLPDWMFYKESGETTAAAVAKIAKKHVCEHDRLRVLE